MKSADKNSDISHITQLIIGENITALEAALKDGWNINKPITVYKYRDELPIVYALENKKLTVAKWLISKKAKLNDKKQPTIVFAVLCGKQMIQLLLDNGADINAHDRLTRNVITIALYWKKYDLISYFVQLGFNPKKDSRSIRQAVFSRQFKALQLLIELGFDVNFKQPDQVHLSNESAVQIAARNINDFKTVKYLVEHGADITQKDNYGDRPFTEALLRNDAPLMAYLKALEPIEWHDEVLHLASLSAYNIPASLLAICQSKKRKINITKTTEYGVRYIVLQSVLLLKVAHFRKKEFVEFVSEIDNYDNFLVWYPAKNCLAYMDYEHDEFKVLGKWEDFLSDPAAFFEKYLSGYF